MLLNDNDYSLQTISDKTNISIENLEKLSNKEWDKFKRPQAIGLISIIEREFNEDLSSLKAEAIAYFDTHTQKEPNRPIDLVDAASVAGGGSRVISNIVTIVTLGAIGYAGWYYFAQDKVKTTTDSNITLESSDKGMFASTIESVKNLLGSNKDETSKVLKEANSSKEQTAQEQAEPTIQTSANATQESKTQESANSTSVPKKFDITSVPSSSANSSNSENNSSETKEVVAATNTETNLNTQESNTSVPTQEATAQTVTTQEQNTTQQSSTEQTQASSSEVNSSDTNKSEVDKLLSELDTNSSQKAQEQP